MKRPAETGIYPGNFIPEKKLFAVRLQAIPVIPRK
jgi:hypothetical protein